jgi:hypothetical protein
MDYIRNFSRLRPVEEPERDDEEPKHWYKVRLGTKEVAPVILPDFPYVAAGLDSTHVYYTALVEAATADEVWRVILAVFKNPILLRIEVDSAPEFAPEDAMTGASVRGVVQAQRRRGWIASVLCFWK